MKNKLGFPYEYGDDGGSFDLKSNKYKILLFISIFSVPIFYNPTVACAADAEQILQRISEAMSEIDVKCTPSRSISPVGAAACVIAGVCADRAKKSLAAGNVPVAAAYTCGFATALCSDRVAAYYGY